VWRRWRVLFLGWQRRRFLFYREHLHLQIHVSHLTGQVSEKTQQLLAGKTQRLWLEEHNSLGGKNTVVLVWKNTIV
jgi:hypothetical protein